MFTVSPATGGIASFLGGEVEVEVEVVVEVLCDPPLVVAVEAVEFGAVADVLAAGEADTPQALRLPAPSIASNRSPAALNLCAVMIHLGCSVGDGAAGECDLAVVSLSWGDGPTSAPARGRRSAG
jgi:hypothetical protein